MIPKWLPKKHHTLWLSLPEYQREILDRVKHHWVTAGGVKGIFIRGLLLERGEATPSEIWREWESFCEKAHRMGVPIRKGTIHSLRTYLYNLKRAGLIIQAGEVKPIKGRFPQPIYIPNLERIGSRLWNNPLKALYPYF